MIDIEDVYRAARETVDLLPRVRAMIATTPGVEEQLAARGRVSAAPTPWNDTFAFTAYGIADDARRHESALTLRLFGRVRFRSGTDEQTAECVGRVPVLVAHAREALPDGDQDGVEDIARDVVRWPRECRRVLDELRADEQPWTTAPGGLRCPFCERRLELAPGWSDHPESADVWCRRCRDEHGDVVRWPPSLWTGLVVAPDVDPRDDPDSWVLDAAGSRLVTATSAERLIPGVSAARVRQWAHRGRVMRVDQTVRGEGLYYLSELEGLAAGRAATS